MSKSGIGQVICRLKDRLFFVAHFVRTFIRKIVRDRAIEGLPSRTYLQTVLLPDLAAAGCQRMLFVGVRSYNLAFYRHCEALKIAVWIIDSDPTAAEYGAPNGHFIGDVRQICALTAGLTFDVIIFNGILGFGINTAQDAIAAFDAMAKVAEPNSLILIGWNPGLTEGREIAALRPRLKPALLGSVSADIEFPAHGRTQRYPHRYEIFTFGEEKL